MCEETGRDGTALFEKMELFLLPTTEVGAVVVVEGGLASRRACLHTEYINTVPPASMAIDVAATKPVKLETTEYTIQETAN